MNEYLSMIADYTERINTDYAVLINGDWGNGKTHFLNTVIFPYLRQKDKKPIYISLNGVTSIDEINKQIFFETSFLSSEHVKSFRDNKMTKQMNQFIKIAHNATSILNITSAANSPINYEELIDLKNETVLCFDDLERCEINIVELLGYINRFVEHDKIKTLIVGNEKEIKDTYSDHNKELKILTAVISLASNQEIQKDVNIQTKTESLFFEQKTYDIIKEKLIGKTILFSPNSREVINEIVEEYKEEDVLYYSFLKEKANDIVDIFDKSMRKNIRILKRSLDDFKKSFYILSGIEVPSLEDQVVYQYFIPSLIFGIEYRSGIKKTEILNDLTTQIILPSSSILNNNPVINLFANYLKGFPEPYEFYISQVITQYIITNLMSETELIKEAKNISQKKKRQKSNNGDSSSLNSLFELTENFLDLENEVFSEYVNDVLNKVKEGFYPLEYLPRIFYQFELFSKQSVINFKKSDIIDLFTKGLSKSIKTEKEVSRFQMWHIENKSANQVFFEHKVAEKLNELESQKIKTNLEVIINLLPSDTIEFTKLYYTLVKEENGHKAIMKHINIPTFFNKLVQLSNQDIGRIRQLYNSIYSFSSIHDYYMDDYLPLTELIKLLEEHMNKLTGITLLQFEILKEDLKDRVKILSENKSNI